MLAEAHGVKKFVIVCGTTDLRKGIEGLACIIQKQYASLAAHMSRIRAAERLLHIENSIFPSCICGYSAVVTIGILTNGKTLQVRFFQGFLL